MPRMFRGPDLFGQKLIRNQGIYTSIQMLENFPTVPNSLTKQNIFRGRDDLRILFVNQRMRFDACAVPLETVS